MLPVTCFSLVCICFGLYISQHTSTRVAMQQLYIVTSFLALKKNLTSQLSTLFKGVHLFSRKSIIDLTYIIARQHSLAVGAIRCIIIRRMRVWH